MRRKLGALLLAFLMLVQLIPNQQIFAEAAAEGIKLNFYYSREDQTYDGWSIWMWGDTAFPGTDVKFTDIKDGVAKATVDIDPSVSEIGYIVRTENWTKDVDKDQFISLTDISSGTINVYVTSGKEGEKIEYGEDVVKGVKLQKASYNGDGTITVITSGETSEEFKVLCDGKEVKVKSQKLAGDNTYTLILEDKLDTDLKYTVQCGQGSCKVKMPVLYSTKEFEDQYTYTGKDLGAKWTKDATTFKIWAPTAKSVFVNLYKSGTEGTDDLIEKIEMKSDVNGTWVATKEGDLNKTYYTYTVNVKGEDVEACDPYAVTTGVNGKRAMVLDLSSTNPEGWESDKDPNAGNKITDNVIYEAHVRDLTADASSGAKNVGKFLGVSETGTTTKSGNKTGLDHIKELGITHLHILPFYDYGSVDETKDGGFNWGYDPVNYNVPEGSYSSDPYNGEVRVREAKQMVKELHDNKISVVMDVVYNHVHQADNFSINKIVPEYFSRVDEDGKYSNGSGCGNDTASERSMVKKYIVDSVKYWADEYHIDGFRFDLVGLIDTETINEIMKEVHKTHPNVIFYGEGWSMDTTLTKSGYTMATQKNSIKTPGFAYFNDNIRDGLKGSVFNTETGFVSGKEGMEQTIIDAFLGSSDWCSSPSQSVNYTSCHDNMTLFDRLVASREDASKEDIIKMNNLSAAIYLTSEGIPFMQAGEEILRTKVDEDGKFVSNSYNVGDNINSIKWDTLEDETYADVFKYYQGLIKFRKAHEGLRLATAKEVSSSVKTLDGLDVNVVGFTVKEKSQDLIIIFNANNDSKNIDIPSGDWKVYVNDKVAGTTPVETVKGTTVKVAPISTLILVGKQTTSKPAVTKTYKATKIKKIVNDKKAINISWDKVSGVKGYRVYRQTDKGSWTKVKTTSSTSYADTKVSNGKTYTYRVEAYGDKAKTSVSKTAKIYRLSAATLKSLKVKKGIVTVKWSKNSKVSGYEIKYSTDKNFKVAKTIKKGQSTTSATFKAAKKAKKYYVKIRSYKKSGSTTYYGTYSSVSSVKIK